MLPHRLLVAYGWIIMAVINLGVFEYTQFWPSAVLAGLTAGVAGAMFVGVLRDLL